jgi:hypothetical protein
MSNQFSYQSAILISIAPNHCNPYCCTKCGAYGASPYCCGHDDRQSDLARRAFGPHPIRQQYAGRSKVHPVI